MQLFLKILWFLRTSGLPTCECLHVGSPGELYELCTNLQLSYKLADCPGCLPWRVLCVCAFFELACTHFPFYHLVHTKYSWTLILGLSARLLNWSVAHFPFLCILLFAQKTHLISTLRAWVPLSDSQPLSCSLDLSHPSSSCPCLLKATAKDCGIHFGHAVSTANVGHSKMFFP